MKKIFFLLLIPSLLQAAIIQPQASDKLGTLNHAKMHRVIAIDSVAPDQSLIALPDGTISMPYGALFEGESLADLLAGKVDIVPGYGLSQENFTTAEKTFIAGLSGGGEDDYIFTVSDRGTVFFDGSKVTGNDAIGLKLIPGSDEHGVHVRSAADNATVLRLFPATTDETIAGIITNQPTTPSGVSAAISYSISAALSGSRYRQILTYTTTWNPESMGGYGNTSQNFTVTGAAIGDVSVASLSSAEYDNAVYSSKVTGANQVTVYVRNLNGVNHKPNSGTLTIKVIK